MPARHRMRRRADFDTAVRRGQRSGRASLAVHFATPGDVGTPALVGLVVSKAVGPAVVRNRVRRRLRHLVAARVGALPSGSLLVIRANPAAAATPSDQLADDLDRSLAKATRQKEVRR